ncbi:MAG: TetR/AcrR family transcriptional regulator [Actinomycetota bacterium]|nr:TetR/AcrR family transcriptional regulator [Actinomycetota bacterium]
MRQTTVRLEARLSRIAGNLVGPDREAPDVPARGQGAPTVPRPVSSPRRAELVAAAAQLFSARGYHGTSMQHLGRALGLQRGSLYAHIGSKEELLFDVVDQGAERFLAMARLAASSKGPAASRLRALLVGHVSTAAQHLDAATVFLNEWRYLSPGPRARIQAKRDLYEAVVRAIIADGVASGEFAPGVDAAMAGRLVLSAGNWVYTWYRPDGALSADAIGEQLSDLILDGLVKEGPP